MKKVWMPSMRGHSVRPGFGLTLGFTLVYLGLVVLLPLAAVAVKTSSLTWAELSAQVTEPRVLAAYRVSFGASLAAATINAVFGFVVAWVLVRYRFPGGSMRWWTCHSRCRRPSPGSR